MSIDLSNLPSVGTTRNAGDGDPLYDVTVKFSRIIVDIVAQLNNPGQLSPTASYTFGSATISSNLYVGAAAPLQLADNTSPATPNNQTIGITADAARQALVFVGPGGSTCAMQHFHRSVGTLAAPHAAVTQGYRVGGTIYSVDNGTVAVEAARMQVVLTGTGTGTVVIADWVMYNSTSGTAGERWRWTSDGHYRCFGNATQDIAQPSAPLRTVYANAFTTTCDERCKQQMRPFTPAELAAAKEMQAAIQLFRFNTDVDQFGDAAPFCAGPLAQALVAILLNHGLDPSAYGFLRHQVWAETPAVPAQPAVAAVIEDGVVVVPAIDAVPAVPLQPGGDRYSVDQSSFLLWTSAASLQRELAHEDAFAALTARVAASLQRELAHEDAFAALTARITAIEARAA